MYVIMHSDASPMTLFLAGRGEISYYLRDHCSGCSLENDSDTRNTLNDKKCQYWACGVQERRMRTGARKD